MLSPEHTSVDQVLRGLDAAFAVLVRDNATPTEALQALESFAEKSQQLTNVMYKEFEAATGQPWVASSFPGWNEYTALFKELRRESFHEAPIRLGVFQEKSFDFGDGRTVTASAPLEMTIPELYGDAPRPELRMDAYRDGVEFGPVVTASYSHYFITPGSDVMQAKLAAAGTNQLSALAEECSCALHQYVDFYKSELAKATESA